MCLLYGIQQSHGKQGNARFTNNGHLHFVSAAFGFHCGHWKTKYVSELFSFPEVCHEFLKMYCLNIVVGGCCGSIRVSPAKFS